VLRALGIPVLLLVTACSAREPAPRGHVEIVASPPEGDVAAWVGTTRSDLHARGRTVLVYEGAIWCEPCQRFHEAVAAGKLDEAFPNLTLLEFDADRDAERLALAGYAPQLIPFFAAPGDDGRASGQAIEGGVKGDGAVDQIAKRLASLVGPP
jgi:thiol-disulfide isomerase/thioredoxin